MQTATPGASISPHLPVRQDWLDRRREEIIEPELPIVDPHHHLVDRPETGRYLLPDLLVDTGCGHNVTATVYLEWLSMYRAKGPVELRPVGEIEFVNGVASMAASGTYDATRVCAGIVAFGPERAMFERNFLSRQGQLRLCGAMERVQAHLRGLLRRRESGAFRRYG